MKIYLVGDADAQRSVIIAASEDDAIRNHCAHFGCNQENCQAKAIGFAFGELAPNIVLTN